MSYVFDRHSVSQKRGENEIGFSSVRGGTIVGEHDVIFAGENETVTLSHKATDRSVFAKGAIKASLYINTKTKGIFNMQNLISEL